MAGDNPALSDIELTRSFVAGSNDALSVLVERHQNRVYGLAYRVLGNRPDALDATQEVFLLLVRKLKTFREQSAFSTWLWRITINVCNDMLRAKSRRPMPVEDTELAAAEQRAGGERAVIRAAPDPTDRIAVHQALGSLDVDHRAVLVLREIEDLSYEEIAEVLALPIGTVKSRIARARAALARTLGGPGMGEPGETPGRLSGEST